MSREFNFNSAMPTRPVVTGKNGVHPFLMFGTISHEAVDGIYSTFPIPMIRSSVSGTYFGPPSLIMDRVRLSFIVRFMSFGKTIAKAFALATGGYFRFGFFCMFAALGRRRFAFVRVLQTMWMTFLGISQFKFLPDFLSSFGRMMPTCLTFSGHGEFPQKNGANSAKVLRYPKVFKDNTIKLYGICQADNAEPAGEIAKGSLGVCDGQG